MDSFTEFSFIVKDMCNCVQMQVLTTAFSIKLNSIALQLDLRERRVRFVNDQPFQILHIPSTYLVSKISILL